MEKPGQNAFKLLRIGALVLVTANLLGVRPKLTASAVPSFIEEKPEPDKVTHDDKGRLLHREHRDSDGGFTEDYKYEDPKHQDEGHPTTTIRKKLDKEGKPVDGGWTDTVTYDDNGAIREKTHEDQDAQGKTTGGISEKHETRGGFSIDTVTVFGKDKKPKERLIDQRDENGRLRNTRREYLDDKGKIVGGTETTYIYKPDGNMTEEQKSLP